MQTFCVRFSIPGIFISKNFYLSDNPMEFSGRFWSLLFLPETERKKFPSCGHFNSNGINISMIHCKTVILRRIDHLFLI